jgi:hypothetical protein
LEFRGIGNENILWLHQNFHLLLCEANPDVDCNFTPFLHEKMKGDSTSPYSPEVAVGKKRGRKTSPSDNVNQLIDQGTDLMKYLKENRKIKKKQKSLAMQIEIAGRLGNNELLLKLMEEVKEEDSD